MKNLILREGKKFLSRDNPLSDYLLRKVGDRRGILQRKLLPVRGGADGQRAFTPADLNRSGSDLVFDVRVEGDADVRRLPSVAGYIPHVKGKTRVVIYNFFSKNYGIRRQLLGRLALCDGAAVKEVKWFLLPADAVATLDCGELLAGDGGYLIVELFHPRLPRGHAGHDGHLRFWGVYGDYNATVHSSPIEKVVLTRPMRRAYRRHLPVPQNHGSSPVLATMTSLFGAMRLGAGISGDFSRSDLNFLGYVRLDQDGAGERPQPRAIWHDRSFDPPTGNPTFAVQLVAVPGFQGVDGIIYFNEAITRRERVTLHFKDDANRTVKTVTAEVGPESELQLSSLVDSDLSAYSFIAVAFDRGAESSVFGYVNLFYVMDGKVCDNVHCHQAMDGRVIDTPADFRASPAGPQCLKFMHFPPLDRYQSVLSVWGAADDIPIKVRFMLEDRDERVVNLVLRKWVVNHFDLGALAAEHGIPGDKRGVVQLESFVSNPHANLATCNASDHSISVDHLTGG